MGTVYNKIEMYIKGERERWGVPRKKLWWKEERGEK